jgi:hypothetical protein
MHMQGLFRACETRHHSWASSSQVRQCTSICGKNGRAIGAFTMTMDRLGKDRQTDLVKLEGKMVSIMKGEQVQDGQ